MNRNLKLIIICIAAFLVGLILSHSFYSPESQVAGLDKIKAENIPIDLKNPGCIIYDISGNKVDFSKTFSLPRGATVSSQCFTSKQL